MFLGIAFMYIITTFHHYSAGYVANKEISKNGIDGVGRDDDDLQNLEEDDNV